MINQNLISLLELLRIESNAILQHKIRLGSENEGGYILIDNIKHMTKLYSFYDTFPSVYPFEKHFVNYTNSIAHFYNTKLLAECLFENNDLGKNYNMVLKINMENMSFLLNLPDDILNQFEQVIVVLYSTVTDSSYKVQVLNKLKHLFHIVHVHANNNYPLHNDCYMNIPDTLELTYIRKNSYTLYNTSAIKDTPSLPFFPSNFDSPSNPLKPDIYLTFYPFKEYYFSLSTIPSRMKNLKNVIDSLQNQFIKPKKIFVHIPRVYRRFPNVTFEIPDLSGYSNVEIVRCGDYGSATKFLPMMFMNDVKHDDNIILVDDDHAYDPFLAVKLIDLMDRYPNSASCMFGVTNALYFKDRSWNTISNTQNLLPGGFRGHKEGYIDVFEGFGGVCLQKRFFTTDVLFFPIHDIYAHDDIWFSAHVIKNGFKIVVSGESIQNIPFQYKLDALCLDNQTFTKSANLMRYLQDNFKIYL